MKFYVMPHGAYSVIKEKEAFSLNDLINECNNKMMAKMGYTIFGQKSIDSNGITVYDGILYNHIGVNTYK